MNIFVSLTLGLVEGLTEFLPISSTFHLIYAGKIMALPATPFLKLFEVAIQGGAIFALVFLYLGNLLHSRRLRFLVLASFLPTALVGALLYSLIKAVFFESDFLMLTVFVLMGGLFLWLEHRISQRALVLTKSLTSLTLREAVILGFVQALSVIPGVSRAGAVISGLMFMGYTRAEAAKYTFLLSLPTILAASAYDLFKQRDLLSSAGPELGYLAAGFASAFVVAYLVVNWLLAYLKNHTLTLFAWYRFGIALVLLLYLYT